MKTPQAVRNVTQALVVAGVLLAGAPARAVTTVTITDAPNPYATEQLKCPRPDGSALSTAVVPVDAFTVTSDAAATLTRIAVQIIPASAATLIERVEVRGTDNTLYGTRVPTSTAGLESISLSVPLPASTTPTQYQIAIVPKEHKAMPPAEAGASVAVQVRVTDFSGTSAGAGVGGSTADPMSSSIRIDNGPPDNVLWENVTRDASSITLDWAGNPSITVLRRLAAPVGDVPADGSTLTQGTTYGTNQSYVAYVGSGPSHQDTVTPGKPYYYRVFVSDSCGNYSSGTELGPLYAGTTQEGSTTKGTLVPVVGIMTPVNGAATSPVRVQVRVFSPLNNGATQPINGAGQVKIYADNGVATPTEYTLKQRTVYGSAVDSGVFEYTTDNGATWTGLPLANGTWTLRAWAQNASGSVYSGAVGVVVNDRGDGRLLVRENSDQLCQDCHAVKTHSSESVGSGYGSWAVGCRACHQPHGTTNASLIATEIVPPQLAGPVPPTKVSYSGPGDQMNPAGTGLCQACHTQTTVMTRGVNPEDPETGKVHGDGASCDTCHSHAKGQATTCTSCHGDGSRLPATGSDTLVLAAPPKNASGSSDPTNYSVGAHEQHVNRGTYTAPLACAECHQYATHQYTPGDAEVNWGPVASVNNSLMPIWSRASGTCAGTYCHGATLIGRDGNPTGTFQDPAASPSWTAAQTLTCNSCHRAPPTTAQTGHPTNPTCATCHGPGYASNAVSKTSHVNGVVNAPASQCAKCHGQITAGTVDLANNLSLSAPGAGVVAESYDTAGNKLTATPAAGVGAHAAHGVGAIVQAVGCASCHPMPASNTDRDHATGASTIGGQTSRATVALGALADGTTMVSSATNAYTGSNTASGGTTGGTCSTYCHGNFGYKDPGTGTVDYGYGKAGTISWTSTTDMTCNSCHGRGTGATATPPTSGHLATDTACGGCHDGYTNTSINPALHMNGQAVAGVDFVVQTNSCTSCHGDAARSWVASATMDPLAKDFLGKASPPKDGSGVWANSYGIGAHQAHVNPKNDGTAYTKPIECVTCHFNQVPTSIDPTATHRNGAPNTAFSGIASGTTYASHSCTTYCHGTMPITWPNTASVKLDCGACHGNPPTTNNHVANSNCGLSGCHAGYGAMAPVTTVNVNDHVNGTVNVDTANQKCWTCHGTSSRIALLSSAKGTADANLPAAPPKDAAYQDASNAVGAHLAHVYPDPAQPIGQVLPALPCSECHGNVAAFTNTHKNGVSDVVFTSATYAKNKTTGTFPAAPVSGNPYGCTTYCHDAFDGDLARAGSVATWTWTGAAAACGSCHKQAPTDNAHVALTSRTLNAPAAITQCVKCHGNTVDATGKIVYTGNATLHVDGTRNNNAGCASCHGYNWATNTASGTNAPTSADTLADKNNTNAVGAHAAHVTTPTIIATGYACTQCHPNQTVATHRTTAGPVQFDWSASISGATTYTDNASNSTCAASYCHGASTRTPTGATVPQNQWGAGNSTPVWQDTLHTFRACTACHGSPPTLSSTNPHPKNTACDDCHPHGATTGTIASPATTTHVNGTVDLDNRGCALCHGDLSQTVSIASGDKLTAPGASGTGEDVAGNTAPTIGGVGAHLSHLFKANFRAVPLVCADCHDVPLSGTAHATGTTQNVPDSGARATLTWGNLAKGAVDTTWSGGAVSPSYAGSSTRASNGPGGTCSNTFCHGGFNYGSNAAPSWSGSWSTALTTTSLGCTSCHGYPPTYNGHTTDTGCATCHPDYTIAANRGTHIDGKKDAFGGSTCSGCHGDPARTTVIATKDPLGTDSIGLASPPKDGHSQYGTNTNTETTVYVGAHQQHVNQTDTPAYAKPIECVQCHGTAVNTYALTGHQGTPGQVPFSGYALTAQTTFTPANGATSTQASCYATYCHGNFTGGNGLASISWGTGTNGKLGCTSCHPNQPNLPHPTNQTCADCHPTGYSKTGAAAGTVVASSHVDGIVDAPNSATTCAACHGVLKTASVPPNDARAMPGYAGAEDSTGNTLATVKGVGAHEVHRNPAGSATNWSAAYACTACHPSYAAGDKAHANGAVGWGWTAIKGVTPSYNTSTFQCANYCHSNGVPLGGAYAAPATPPTWTSTTDMNCTSCHGNGTTGLALSAKHAKHLNSTTYNYDCARCHSSTGTKTSITTPANHVNGQPNWAFDSTPVNQVAATYTSTNTAPNYTCNTTYCHSNGTSTTTFGAPVNTALNWSTGTASAACDDCHGGNGNATRKLATGSHAAHMNKTNYTMNYACGTCHGGTGGTVATGLFRTTDTPDRTVSTYTAHVNGAINVSTNIASSANAMGFNSSTHQCNSNYCHSSGQVAAVRAYYDPTWGTTTLADDCKQCHGRYSGGTSVTSLAGEPNYGNGGTGTTTANSHSAHVATIADCTKCHSTTVDASGVVNTANGLHTNGTPDVVLGAAYVTGTLPNWDGTNHSCSNLVAGCHTGTRTWGQVGASTCISCHSKQQVGTYTRAQIYGLSTVSTTNADGDDFVRASRHVSNGTTNAIVINADCVLCHAEGSVASSTAGTGDITPARDNARHGAASPTVDLRDLDSNNGDGVAAKWPGRRKDATATITPFDRDQMDWWCLTCHDGDGAAGVSVATGNTGFAKSAAILASTISRTSNVTTVVTAAAHGLTTNDRVNLTSAIVNAAGTGVDYKPGIKQVTVTNTTTFTYSDTAANVASRSVAGGTLDAATTFRRYVPVSTMTRGTIGVNQTVTVTTATAHGFVVGDVVALTPGEQNYFGGWKTVASTPTTTTFTYSDSGTRATPAIPWIGNTPSTAASVVQQYFVKTSARAKSPFNTADTLRNAREGNTHPVYTWRWSADAKVINVKSQFNSGNATASQWASHHNLNQFTKRYGTTQSQIASYVTAFRTKDNAALVDSVGLHCSDCHLNEVNAHGSRNTWYMLASSAAGTYNDYDVAFASIGTSTSTDVCARCHASATYGYTGGASTNSRSSVHQACTRLDDFGLTTLRLAANGDGSGPQIPCLGCHGGDGSRNLGPGMIHGSNEDYSPMRGTNRIKTYRFMGTGATYRFYSPNGTTNPATTAWSSTGAGACYNLQSGGTDTWGACTNHTGDKTVTNKAGRGLEY